MANNNKILQTRVQQKTDITANWGKATNFIPLKGEIIIYEDTHRMKIGDGESYLKDIKYIDETSQADWNENDETAPGYVKNRTHYESWEVIGEVPGMNDNPAGTAEGSLLSKVNYNDKFRCVINGQYYNFSMAKNHSINSDQNILVYANGCGDLTIVGTQWSFQRINYSSSSDNDPMILERLVFNQLNPRFIKNFPYEDKDTIVKEFVILDSDLDDDGTLFLMEEFIGIEENALYLVNIDGIETQAEGKYFEFQGIQIKYIGDINILFDPEGASDDSYIIAEANAPEESGTIVATIMKNHITVTRQFPLINKLHNKFIDAEWIAKVNSRVILPEQLMYYNSSDGMGFVLVTNRIELGQEYIVKYNGEEYHCICESKNAFLYLGSQDNTFPFYIMVYNSSDNEYQTCYVLKGFEECKTLGIEFVIDIPKMPKKFLPEESVQIDNELIIDCGTSTINIFN